MASSSSATRPVTQKWAAQCADCRKWREIPSKDEFEELRSKILEEPFTCRRSAGGSCSDPAAFGYDPSRQTWFAHKPNAPRTPAGFTSRIVPRRTVTSRKSVDVYYMPPVGRRLRSPAEVAAYIAANPELCQGLTPANFSFDRPKIINPVFPVDEEEPSVSAEAEAAD